MDAIQDKKEIKDGFIHNLPIVVKKLGQEEQEYYAVVLNPTPDYLLISPVIDKEGQPVKVREGERIEVATKLRGFLWGGFGIVVEVVTGDFEGIWLTYPKKLQKVQRRGFLRVNITFPVTVTFFQNGTVTHQIKGYCHDLSGSGIAVSVPEFFDTVEDTIINVSFAYKELSVNASIEKIYHAKKGEFYKMGCKFIGVDQDFSDRVHKFVVKEQIAMRKEGLI